MNYTKKQKVLLVLYLLTLAFIFGHSLMPADVSGAESGGLLEFLRPFLRLFLPEERITDHFLRKAAHFSEFALLGFEKALFSDLNNLHEKIHKYSTCLAMGLFAAFIDETIQLFIEGRSGEVRDMWIDLMGFIAGMLAGALVMGIARRGKRGNLKK